MGPLKHIILTFLLFVFLKIWISLPWMVLAGALALTLFIDFVDHSINIFLIKNRLSSSVRKMLLKGKIKNAYSLYYSKRKHGDYKFMVFHNTIFLIVSAVAAIYLKSYVLLLGLVFHFMCDIYELKVENRYYRGFSLKYYWSILKSL